MLIFDCVDNDDILLRLSQDERWLVREAFKIAYQCSSLGYFPPGLKPIPVESLQQIKFFYGLLSEIEED